MDAETKLKLVHDQADAFNREYEKGIESQKLTPAVRFCIQNIQAPFVHALIDMRLKHGMSLGDMEEALCAQVANMVSLFIRSSVPQELGPLALLMGKSMSEKIDDCLYDAIVTNFLNTGEGPTNDDKVH